MILAALGKLKEIHVQLRNDRKLITIGPRNCKKIKWALKNIADLLDTFLNQMVLI